MRLSRVGLGGDAAVARGHDGAAGAAVDEVLHHEEGKEDQREAHPEGGDGVDAHAALGAADEQLAGDVAVIEGKVQPSRVDGDIQAVDHVSDDLAEGQRHDGQIVAAQPQHRNADQNARDAREHAAHDHGQKEAHGFVFKLEGAQHPARGHDAGKRAHAHEARVAKAEFARYAHHEVERNRHDHPHADGHQLAAQRAGHAAGGQQVLAHQIGGDHHQVRHKAANGPFFSHAHAHARHLTLSHARSCPAGRRA